MNHVVSSLAIAGLSSLTVAAHAAAPLEDVVVTATRTEQPVSKVIGSVTIISREEIAKRQSPSLPELLRGEAGIDIDNNGGLGKASAIFLRGGNAAQTLILVDGVRLGSATTGTTSIEFIPVDQIERIEIVRGPRSSLYGADAIGGVIQIFTRKNSGVNASASFGRYNTQTYSAGFGMQQQSFRFSAQGSHQHSDGFNSCVGSFSAACFTVEPDNDGYRNASASARIGYAFGTVADVELSTLYTKGNTDYDGSFTNQTRFVNSAPTLKLSLHPVDVLDIKLSTGVTLDKNDNFENGSFVSFFNTKKRNSSAQADWRISEQHTASIGADYLKDSVDSDTDYARTERDNKGVFAQYLGTLGAHQLSASLRRDNNEQFGMHNTGSAGWKWFVLNQQGAQVLAFNAGYGSAFHAPTFNDLYYPFGSGNPDLAPERSHSTELGVSGQVAAINWSLQTYSTKVNDLIVLDSNWVPRNLSKARLRGAELSISGHWQQLTAAVNLTAQDPRSHAAKTYDKLLPRRSRQSMRVEADYDFGRTQLGATLNAVGKRFDDVANTKPLAGYTTLDLRTNVTLGEGFSVQVKAGNVFDRQYQTARFYNQAGRTWTATLRYQSR